MWKNHSITWGKTWDIIMFSNETYRKQPVYYFLTYPYRKCCEWENYIYIFMRLHSLYGGSFRWAGLIFWEKIIVLFCHLQPIWYSEKMTSYDVCFERARELGIAHTNQLKFERVGLHWRLIYRMRWAVYVTIIFNIGIGVRFLLT